MADDDVPDKMMQRFSLALVEHCVRNTGLESLHAGITPDSETGDYSDVKVVTPYGEIPWERLSRISDEEMKALMIEIVNKVYTFLTHAEDLAVVRTSARWNKPEHDAVLLKAAMRRAALRKGGESEPD